MPSQYYSTQGALIQSINNTSNASPVIVAPSINKRICSLYLNNAVATTAHYVGIIQGTGTPSAGAVMLADFRNSGTAGFTFSADDQYFTNLKHRGYTVVRSSTPVTYTPLGAALSANSQITVTYKYYLSDL